MTKHYWKRVRIQRNPNYLDSLKVTFLAILWWMPSYTALMLIGVIGTLIMTVIGMFLLALSSTIKVVLRSAWFVIDKIVVLLAGLAGYVTLESEVL